MSADYEARERELQAKHAHVPPPADASEVHHWMTWEEGNDYRAFNGTICRASIKVVSGIEGYQWPDRCVDPSSGWKRWTRSPAGGCPSQRGRGSRGGRAPVGSR